ncbi:MAG: hypothetical protein ACK493_03285 [Planctomycetota bacterium]|jgi:hypothetical protein
MSAEPVNPVRNYFAGLAESTFVGEMGVADPPLVDYVSDLLVRFIRSDVVHRIRGVTGRPLLTVAEMVAEAAERIGTARQEVHRQIGDFTLFWAGVYPEALRSAASAQSDPFLDYCREGKRAYHLASQLAIETSKTLRPEPELLERLSDCFELCCYGLREVRRHWEEHDDGCGPGVILLG